MMRADAILEAVRLAIDARRGEMNAAAALDRVSITVRFDRRSTRIQSVSVVKDEAFDDEALAQMRRSRAAGAILSPT